MEDFVLHNLRVEGIQIHSIKNVEIHNSPNSHAHMSLIVEIDEDKEEKLLYEVQSHQTVTLFGGTEVIFRGILEGIKFEKKEQICYADITVESFSKIMDIKKKSRSFQTITATYGTILNQILSEYNGADYFASFQDKPIGKLLVQYKETDWEFLKRIFSEINVSFGSVSKEENIRIYIGVPDVDSGIKVKSMDISKDIREYKKANSYGIEVRESDCLDYTVKIDSVLDIFSGISCNDNNLVIYNVYGKLNKGILEFKYVARSKMGVISLPLYPVSLVGISLEGKIVEVKGKLVRIHMKMDDMYPSEDKYWFPYSTLSSTKDGSGWYYMPEKGDSVRVHFPTKHAQEAIAINSISNYRVPKEGADTMEDPSTKFLSNVNGQKMGMSKNGINIVTRSGAAMLNMNNSGDILISAGNSITISAKDKITVKSKEIIVQAEKKAELISEEGAGILLKEDGNMEINGTEVLIN